jgi:hypothetical protein
MRRFVLPAATWALLMGGVRQADAGFCITLSAASWGNSSFGRGEFSGFLSDTNGPTRDLTQELVGQPTSGASWGTIPVAFGAGDFDIFNNGSEPAAPSVPSYFQPATAYGGSGDMMNLTSFAPRAHISTTPEPVILTLLGIGVVALLGCGWRHRRRQAA